MYNEYTCGHTTFIMNFNFNDDMNFESDSMPPTPYFCSIHIYMQYLLFYQKMGCVCNTHIVDS